MADKNHGHALGLELLKHGKEGIDLLTGERGRGLIQDKNSRIHGQRLCDFYELLLGDAELTHRHIQVHVQADEMQRGLGLCLEVFVVDQPEAARGAPEHDVLGHRYGGNEVELLVDGGDAQRLGGLGVGDFNLCAIHHNAAGIWLVDTGNHLDERGFSGAVFTQQGLDLTPADGEIHAFNDFYLAKGFGYAF